MTWQPGEREGRAEASRVLHALAQVIARGESRQHAIAQQLGISSREVRRDMSDPLLLELVERLAPRLPATALSVEQRLETLSHHAVDVLQTEMHTSRQEALQVEAANSLLQAHQAVQRRPSDPGGTGPPLDLPKARLIVETRQQVQEAKPAR